MKTLFNFFNIFILFKNVSFFLCSCNLDKNELPDDFKNAIPSSEIVKLKVPEAQNGTAAQALHAAGYEESSKAVYYLQTINAVRDLNGMTWALLHFIEDITSYPYTSEVENGYVWGPFTPALSLVTIKFILKKDGNLFSYNLQMRPKEDADADFKNVLSGSYEPEDGALKSDGFMELDYDMASNLDETTQAVGKLTFVYDTTQNHRIIDITFEDFMDQNMDEPINAVYSYAEEADHSGSYGFNMTADVHKDDPQNQDLTLKEKMTINVRWTAEGSGRADVKVTDGDLPLVQPPFEKYQVSECWDQYFNQVFIQDKAYPVNMDPYEGTVVGDDSLCVYTEAVFR